MNTPNSEIQIPASGRRRVRYSDEFKRQVVTACHAPGVSTAAIALANGLNANMLRRWVVESSRGSNRQLATVTKPLAPALTKPAFIPVKFSQAPSAPAADIRIELQHARGAMQTHWPLGAAGQCAQWLREVLS
jgi:transposase-like protein